MVAEIEKLVDEWREAQNKGDFNSYSALYADKFMGVKRSGSRTTRYDREGWLKDRKRMFEKPMTVETEEVDTAAFGASAEVQFSQKWQSGTYEDKGPKRLLIVKQGGTLRIAREEMLSSQLGGSAADHGAGDLYFLLAGGIELSEAQIPKTHGTLTLSRANPEQPWMASAEVDAMDLEPSVRSLLGQEVRTDDGCEATITSFKVISRVTPHFGQQNYWDCRFSEPDCKPTPEAQITEQVYEMGAQRVVGMLDDCAAGRLARFKEEPRLIAASQLSDHKLEEAARKAFAQRQRKRAGVETSWWKSNLEINIYIHPTSHQKLVVGTASNGNVCNDAASDVQVWNVVGDKLLPLASSFRDARAKGAFDTDANGTLELLLSSEGVGGDEWYIWDPGADSDLLVQSYAYFDCPC